MTVPVHAIPIRHRTINIVESDQGQDVGVHSRRVIGCKDETNASVLNKENTPRNDDDDPYTIAGNAVDDVSVPRK